MAEEYGDLYREGVALPPVVLFYDGVDYWLADGFHRFYGAEGAGLTEIDADIRQGTQRDAILFSCGANAEHGFRRSNADKQRAVRRLLDDAEWAGWSNYQIAASCRVSESMVRSMRSHYDKNVVTEERTFTNKHGGTSKMKTSNIGKSKSKPEPVPWMEEEADEAEQNPPPPPAKQQSIGFDVVGEIKTMWQTLEPDEKTGLLEWFADNL